jgi:hypothetical protein
VTKRWQKREAANKTTEALIKAPLYPNRAAARDPRGGPTNMPNVIEDWKIPISRDILSFGEEEETMMNPIVETPPMSPCNILRRSRR